MSRKTTSTTGESEKLMRHYITFEQLLKRSRREFDVKIHSSMKLTATIDDFVILRTLGTGSFGKVVLVRHKMADKVYAMKIMEKINIMKTKQLQHTISEIRFLDAIKFPFIINLDYFFKNNVYIFIVMPFINGGEMFHHLRNMKKFDESMSKFYAAQVILSLEYMHNLGIVYRDLKPENILIDAEGYLKVTDLGFCKKIDAQRTYTLCGTPEYLAPEIILSQGYNFSVDWWSLGVLIFEMNAGFPPFYAKDHMKLYEKIVTGKYAPPPHFSKALRDLAMHILQVDRSKRYGVLKGGARDLKGHEWFKTIDFDLVLSRKVKPFFVPSVESEGDTKFFEGCGDTLLRISNIDEYSGDFKSFSLKLD